MWKNIPGFDAYKYELFSIENFKNNTIYNPYSSSHLAMQIGNILDEEEDCNRMWSEISELLASCKHKQMKDVITDFESEINIFSLNIRHLYDKISKLRDGIDFYQKFDVLCFNECNLKLEKLPKGIEDILLEGFYEPILQPPARSSGRGGSLRK